jgi:hypothetical protein
MLPNDTKHLERVEQQLDWLRRTQPNPGRSRSIHPEDLLSERDEQVGQNRDLEEER